MSKRNSVDYKTISGKADFGDSDRISDNIFQATRVQAQVFLMRGVVQLKTDNLADFYVARSYLLKNGYTSAQIVRDIG